MRIFLLSLCIGFFLLAGIGFLVIDKDPLSRTDTDLSYDHIKQVQKLISDNRPTWFTKYKKRNLVLSESDINLLISYTLSQGLDLSWLSGKIKITADTATGVFTLRLPDNYINAYVNLTLILAEQAHLPELISCTIGKIKIPRILLATTLPLIHQRLLSIPEYKDFWKHSKTIDQVIFNQKKVVIEYQLSPQSLEQIKQTGRELLFSETEQERLLFYHNRLAELAIHFRYQDNCVIDLIKGMIRAAGERSRISKEPVLENRSALQAMGLYAAGQPLYNILNKKQTHKIKTAVPCRMLFHNRSDLVKHFLISAALSASAGSRSASFIGIFKEVEDATFAGGSGFSFADIAADKAGVRFGEFATRSSTSAAGFQKKVAVMESEADIMPSIRDLPEGMMEITFKSRFKDIDSEAYKKTEAEIERRLDRCAFYKR